MTNVVNWFELPAENMDRAVKFYNNILAAELRRDVFKGNPMAFFPGSGESDVVGGALVKMEDMKPATEGTLVYLNGGEDLSAILDRVPGAGGSIQMPKTILDENIGYIAAFVDSEGNRVGLHSPK